MDILNFTDIAAVPVITVIAFLTAECAKLTPMPDEWLPALCGVVGAIFGVVALYVSPALMPATDVLSAIAVGIVSGLAATGAHQFGKQLKKVTAETAMDTGKH